MSIVQEISCSHCGAPISFKPGEIIATCKYCGYTVVIETGRAFTFEHSMLSNAYDQTTIDEPIRNWMRGGFLKPADLARKAKVAEKALVYTPFWVVTIEAETSYKGIFERIAPAIMKEGSIRKEYDWLVLARKATEFPTREYEVPLEGKVPFDFRKIEGFAKTLNSEVDRDGAIAEAKQEIEEHHRFLAQQDVDRIVEMKTDFVVREAVYLHAPVWFITYDYSGKTYRLWIDGTTGIIIKGDIPPEKFGIL